MPSKVDPAIIKGLGLDPSATNIAHLNGHSTFSSLFKITTILDDQVVNFFVKTGRSAAMFGGEHASLNAIHDAVPSLCVKSRAHGALSKEPGRFFLATDFVNFDSGAPPGTGMSLAAKLAKLHTTPAPIPKGFDKPMFGFPVTTCCGSTLQNNSWKESWAEFFAENRLRSIMKEIKENRGDYLKLAAGVETVASKVVPRLIGDDVVKGIVPVVVHGDLWVGNHSFGEIAASGVCEEIVFDPSSVYGHSEYEFGIIRMFGGFTDQFYAEYEKLVPKAEPKGEWEDRVMLYELYHHLNHFRIFGESYEDSAMAIVKTLITKYAS